VNDQGKAHSPNWQRFRQLMPVSRKWAYFDHAAVAPLPSSTKDEITDWLREATEEGDTVWPNWAKRVEEIRVTAAKMIGTSPSEVAFVPNTTSGISLVAEGFPWQSGDNVVTLANEFPSNLYPWLNLESRGVETRRLEVAGARVDIDALIALCDSHTRIISVSWIGYASGWRIDLDELVERAHQQGILVFLDAIQGLGVFPLDVQRTPVDFLAADGHKWMLGPEGAGIFFRREEHLELLRPLNVGWNSVVHSHDFSHIELVLRPEAARYEGGSQNMIGVLGLGASLNLLAEFGVSPDQSPIAERIIEVTDLAVDRLTASGARVISERDSPHSSGIVSFEMPDQDSAKLRHRCLGAGVVLSCRDGRLRISPHAYNNEEDIERLVTVLCQR
jgi:cysteine desulfurase/selenocysteine lyase